MKLVVCIWQPSWLVYVLRLSWACNYDPCPGRRARASGTGARFGGIQRVLAPYQNSSGLVAKAALFAAVTVLGVAGTVSSASAQGFFDSLFGRRSVGPSTSAYADPSHWNPFAPRAPEAP